MSDPCICGDKTTWHPECYKMAADDAHLSCIAAEEERELLRNQLTTALSRVKELEKEANAKQAKIDALMWEHCPDEMTPEQIEEWGKHQRPDDTALASQQKA